MKSKLNSLKKLNRSGRAPAANFVRKPSWFRPVWGYVLIQTMLLSTLMPTAQASIENDMADMFNSMGATTSVQNSGAYRTQSANVYQGGSVRARWGNKPAPDLIGFQPPGIKAGCGGIDIWGGSFSFVNKEQFMQFTRNLANNAAGVAFEIGMSALDPLIQNAISTIRSMVNAVNENAQSSCQAAQSLVAGAVGKVAQQVGGECKAQSTANGSASDASDSKWYCASDTNTMKERLKAWSENKTANGNTKNKKSIEFTGGNYTLYVLRNFNISDKDKEWLMSLVGTMVAPKPVEGQEAVPEAKFVGPTISKVEDLFGDSSGPTSSSTVNVNLLVCRDDQGKPSSDYLSAVNCKPEPKTITNLRSEVQARFENLANQIVLGDRNQDIEKQTLGLIEYTSEPILLMMLQDAYVRRKAIKTTASSKEITDVSSNLMVQSVYDLVTYDMAHTLLTNLVVSVKRANQESTMRSENEMAQYNKSIESVQNMQKILNEGRTKKKNEVQNQIKLNQKIDESKLNALKSLGVSQSIVMGNVLGAMQ